MCGICGVVDITGRGRAVIPADVLEAMTDVIAHRGPDDSGLHIDDGFALGVRRLSIVDVEGGHQPFFNERGDVVAAQNGELYEHARIRAALQREGHSFRSRCDTEILPHLYERYGVEFMRELRGMFGIAVWDASRRRAVIVRDRLGIKPLYYAEVDGLLVFGSELKCLLASGLVSDELDYEAIDAYLTLGFVPAPRTPLKAVSKLMPGHRIVIADGKMTVDAYWSYPEFTPSRASEAEMTEELLEQLEESVRLRLMSDVPFGAMLSGGLDSSLIVGLMARNLPTPVQTFAVGFAGDAATNELADARKVARMFGTEHHELELSESDLSVDLPDLVWHLDEPLADLSSVGFHALSGLAVQHVTMALSGQGADELLAGYNRHRAAAAVPAMQRVPGARHAFGALATYGPERARRPASFFAQNSPEGRYLHAHSKLPDDLRRRLTIGELHAVGGSMALQAARASLHPTTKHPLDAMLEQDGRLGLVDDMLHYFDRTSMAHSLEVRVPFLDHKLVEFCATIPPGMKVHRGTTKHILRNAARGIVPDEIIDKPKIGFFNGAVGSWFRTQAEGPAVDRLLDPGAATAGMLNRSMVESLVAEQRAGRDTHSHLLLSILMLEVWLSTYLPRARSSSALLVG